ncbi:MAG: hypothetical protein GY906_06700 [bacterium]|nr:hypothetical protein [bacterium]
MIPLRVMMAHVRAARRTRDKRCGGQILSTREASTRNGGLRIINSNDAIPMPTQVRNKFGRDRPDADAGVVIDFDQFNIGFR